jgi:tetratricopeptide (TPR) repeat protein
MSRNYHNTTAYYNIYWNGFETYKELLTKIESFGYDNHSNVLRVFEYGSILDTAQTMPLTTRMIEKGTKAVQKHSIRIRGVEHVKTMEKAYMLMGKGYFFQHNYSMARTVFNFVSSQFPNSPIRYESLLWSARTYIQEKEFEMASALILQVQNNETNLYKHTRRELSAVTADFYIAQGRYNEAIPFLKEAVNSGHSRDFKNRMEFILGQIFQREGRLQEAYMAYRNVIKRNPNMELEYNARINMALSYDGAYANRKGLTRQLEKMLEDTKNERFFGRIYFVLAEMALQDNDIFEGMDYLKKSVEFSGSNRDQLAISATRLADLYFDQQNYVAAQRYYRNAVSVMTSDHPDFIRVDTRAQNLAKLVEFLDIVRYEEQMQYLAELPENRRNAEIERIIEDLKSRAAETAEAAPRTTQTTSQTQQSTWYFYNEQARSFGANEFVRRWGRRTNEDFWFLNQKPAFATNRTQDQEEIKRPEEEDQRTTSDYTLFDKEYYLVNMPVRAAAKERSDKRLEENLFLLGIGYFDLVEEPKSGIQTLEKLLQKFPNTDYKLQAYYYLYRMNLVLEHQAGREKYRNLLIREFPNSEQTRQITDPDFYRMASENTRRAEALYQHTFEAYQIGMFDAVIENAREAERRFPGNAHMPRFRYLETMALGRQQGAAATIQGLEQFIREHPQEKELTELARTTIEFLTNTLSKDQQAAVTEAREQQAAQEAQAQKMPEHDVSMFTMDNAAQHYTLIFVNIPEVNPDVLKIRLADFNRRSYAQDNLRISGEVWNDEYYLIYVHSFRTISVARGFLEELQDSRYVFGGTPKEFYELMLITSDNFQTLMKERNKEVYRYFYEMNYNP